MKTILITGGAGFLAKGLITHLSNDPIIEKIIVLDNFITSDKSEFLQFISKFKQGKVIFHEYDITNTNVIDYLIDDLKDRNISTIDEIYHLASLASPPFYKKFPIETLDVGYIGTKNMLELAKKLNSKILFSSTSEVYGDAIVTPQHENYYGNVNSFGERSCYSDNTEILTENGYKLFSELDYNDKVATLNFNNELEYHIPDEIIKQKYIGDMYEYKNWNIDLNVTPNHKMYVKKRDYDKFELLPADSKLSWDRAILKKTCNYIGKEQEWFYFPDNLKKLTNQKTPFIEKVNMDLWLEFMGYYLSEGHTRISIQKKNSPNGKIYECGIFKVQISQSQTVKPLQFEKIKQCLDKMPFKYNISRAGNSYFVISNKQLAHYLIQFGKSKDKFIPSNLLSLSKRQLCILLDALILGDGTNCKNNSNYRTYYSSSYKLMSNIQEILLKIGTFGNILSENRKDKDKDKKEHQMYYMTINSRPDRDYTYSKPNITNYNGYVYCVNVKNHVIFVRRNGKALFCGNCYDESKRVAEALCYTYLKTYGVDVKIARIFNTYGPHMLLNDGRIITEVIKHLKNGTTVTIYGDGEQTRSICYVKDTVRMLIKLMNSMINEPVNIGNNQERTINETVNMIENVWNQMFNKQPITLNRVYKPLTQNDPLQRKPCLEFNKQVLGEIEYTSFEEGIKETIKYFV
jgi:UDP-glucuronate decarboxylase